MSDRALAEAAIILGPSSFPGSPIASTSAASSAHDASFGSRRQGFSGPVPLAPSYGCRGSATSEFRALCHPDPRTALISAIPLAAAGPARVVCGLLPSRLMQGPGWRISTGRSGPAPGLAPALGLG